MNCILLLKMMLKFQMEEPADCGAAITGPSFVIDVADESQMTVKFMYLSGAGALDEDRP